ncbi:MAG: cation:proton antiporter [Crenarchaeota archaeon]|nr:MAG: cation:proton antiporter [Thermoproteota archaeon]RDJ33962.1 MAG: cation:proton antiporter [Thermoproteota archaeon]RDJ36923.1 MAG: cation:proton antiporter [Thermoproteota archaeon]RDJ37542.1 MAG: cation:proton antiporter [Thermoproteota archaeon]
MEIGAELIGDLGYLLIISAGVGIVAYLLRQPLVLGFLVAGILIGPFGPFSLIDDVSILHNFSDIAIVLLLFGVGLTFPISQFRSIGKIGSVIAIIEVAVMLAIGFGVAQAFGWSIIDSMFLAAALSISSTAIIVKVLEEMDVVQEPSSQLIIGILIIEDLIAAVLISMLHSTILLDTFSLDNTLWLIAQIGMFIGLTALIGCLSIPKLFSFLSNFERYEFMILAALGLAFGLSYLSYSLGFSAATGAFLAGVILAGTRFSDDISTLIAPTREIFVAIFFVTIGALMDVQIITQYWIPIVIITIVTIIGKTVATYAGVRLFRLGSHNALGIGLSMAQLGEFSFIVLKVGQDMGAISAFLFPIVGTVVILTTFLAPFLIKKGTKMMVDIF